MTRDRHVPVINVNERGENEDGETFDVVADEYALAEGFLTEKPVTLKYPDGTLRDAIQVLITPKGIAAIAQAASDGQA